MAPPKLRVFLFLKHDKGSSHRSNSNRHILHSVPSFALIIQFRGSHDGHHFASTNNLGQLQQIAKSDPNQAIGFKNEASNLLIHANSGFSQGSLAYMRLAADQRIVKPIDYNGSLDPNDLDSVCNSVASVRFTCQFPATGITVISALRGGDDWVVSQDADPASFNAMSDWALYGFSLTNTGYCAIYKAS